MLTSFISLMKEDESACTKDTAAAHPKKGVYTSKHAHDSTKSFSCPSFILQIIAHAFFIIYLAP